MIRKDYDHLEHFFEDLIPGVKRLAVVGGGFIGVEFADEVRKSGVAVTVIEQLPHILLRNFDQEVSVRIEQELRARDIAVHTGSGVTALEGDGEDGPVRAVRLANGERIPAEAVLVAIGATPCWARAWASRWPWRWDLGRCIPTHRRGSHVFAVGDCAFKQDFLLRRSVHSLLASTAAAEGRTAGMNLFGLRNERYNAGTIAVYASQLGDLAFGCAGMTAA